MKIEQVSIKDVQVWCNICYAIMGFGLKSPGSKRENKVIMCLVPSNETIHRNGVKKDDGGQPQCKKNK